MNAFFVFIASLLGITTPTVQKPIVESVAKFGEVQIYKDGLRKGTDPQLVVFILNDLPAWNPTAANFAASVALDHNLAVVIDLSKYVGQVPIPKFCTSVTNDLDDLNKALQQKLGFTKPVPTVLIGKALGANAVELAYDQSGKETFYGFMAISDCQIAVPATRCEVKHKIDSSMSQSAFYCGRRVGAEVGGTEQVMVDHRALQKRSWVESIKDRVYAMADQGNGLLKEPALSTVEIFPPQGSSQDFVVMYSGDGGWATFVQKLAAKFQQKGTPVLGINSLKYFWSKKTPVQAAADLEILLKKYEAQLHFKHVHLIGFSFGADVIPLIVQNLPETRQKQIEHVTLLSIGKLADIEFHLDNWISSNQTGVEIKPELLKLKSAKIDCLYGQEQENETVCNQAQMPSLRPFKMPGGHFLNWDTDGIFEFIQK